MLDALRTYAADEYDVRGIIATKPEEVGQVFDDAPVLGTGRDLMNFARRDRISEVIITASHELPGRDFSGVDGCLRARHHDRADDAGSMRASPGASRSSTLTTIGRSSCCRSGMVTAHLTLIRCSNGAWTS